MSKKQKYNKAQMALNSRACEVSSGGIPLRGRGQRSPARGDKPLPTLDSPGLLNCTKHMADDVIIGEGYKGLSFTIIDLNPRDRERVLELQDFNSGIPECGDIRRRAEAIADIAVGYGLKYAWVGGAGYLMPPLESALKRRGITPVYSWSKRDYMETVDSDGVRRLEMYREHGGWVVIDG